MDTVEMRNVYESIDHNSQWYSLNYLNQLVPMITRTALMMKSSAEERVTFARSLLEFDMNATV